MSHAEGGARFEEHAGGGVKLNTDMREGSGEVGVCGYMCG